ncbi:ABC transporter permease subunit [Brevundimonas sp. SL130]|uniref:ABC transporter permease subunit n=1 Tax=Brevundimonas sp. SL130 TaxID=2995143 RepID=UPI00226C81AB|nr:ABC transporter permease subunit [Brevundimonas sp. SL130]WAC61154.1 ABC transporter permease subunit [Brevundimonas sp. SL130]
MLVDALKSEAYRISRNRTAIFCSVLLTPLLIIVGGLIYQILTKAKGDALAAKANLPPELGNQPVNLAEAFGFAAGNGANGVLLVFMLLAAAAVYAGDYRWETWRLISARNARPWLLLGKIGVMKALAMIAMLTTLVAAFIYFISEALVTGRPMSFDLTDFKLVEFLLTWLLSYIRIVQYGLIALLAAVISRSLLAALFVPWALGFVQTILGGPLLPIIGWAPTDWVSQLLLPGLAYDTLKAAVAGDTPAPDGLVIKAITSLVLWCVVPVAASIAWFQRQDLSKE